MSMSMSYQEEVVPKCHIEDVTEEKGEEYINWIKITKEKLKERECISMQIRGKKSQNIINRQCQLFESNFQSQNIRVPNYKNLVSSDIINECLNKMYLSLERWNGINVTKTKKSLDTFREYFTMAKCWFDQTKKHLLAPAFWIKLFMHISEFTKTAANTFFKNNNNYSHLKPLYSRHLEFHIINGIFNGKLRFAGTKSQPLIPCGVLKECNPMKRYLLNLDKTLNIEGFVLNFSQTSNTFSKNITATELLRLVNKQLMTLTHNSKQIFQYELSKISSPVSVSVVPDTLTTFNNTFNNFNNMINIPIPTINMIMPPQSSHSSSISSISSSQSQSQSQSQYSNNHSSTYSSATQRYSPTNSSISSSISSSQTISQTHNNNNNNNYSPNNTHNNISNNSVNISNNISNYNNNNYYYSNANNNNNNVYSNASNNNYVYSNASNDNHCCLCNGCYGRSTNQHNYHNYYSNGNDNNIATCNN